MNHLPTPRLRCNVSALRHQVLLLTLAGGAVLSLAGCGGTVSVPSGTTTAPPVDYQYLTGNWEFEVTPATGTSAPFTAMAGFINEQGQDPGTFDESTAVFQVSPTTACYTGATVIPMGGNVQGTTAKYSSFSVNGQYFSITTTRNTAGTTLTGTYNDSGGCVKGVTGTVIGNRFMPLTGAYSGTITGSSPALGITANLSQGGQGTGSGVTEVGGSGVFTGFTCFTKGSLSPITSNVLGSAVTLDFTTNDPTAAHAVVTGTFDAAATTVTVNSIQVTSGSCSGAYGTATLTKQ